jgi:hypothetical protein
MSHPAQGLRRGALDAAFATDEARKSELLVRAQLLRDAGDDEAAAQKFAQAAEIEEHLSQACLTHGLVDKGVVHRFSAASCWAQAGNFYRAIILCEELLALPELPPRLREHVSSYAGNVRARRSDWYAALTARAVGVEA